MTRLCLKVLARERRQESRKEGADTNDARHQRQAGAHLMLGAHFKPLDARVSRSLESEAAGPCPRVRVRGAGGGVQKGMNRTTTHRRDLMSSCLLRT